MIFKQKYNKINKNKTIHKIHNTFLPTKHNDYHPHLLHKNHIDLIAVFLVLVKVFFFSIYIILPTTYISSAAITTNNVLNLTNEARKNNNLKELKLNQKLSTAAQKKAEHMLEYQYFAHYAEDGTSPWDFINKAGYDYLVAGENLAIDFYQAEDVQEAWMNSPGHRANILKKDYQEIGIGISTGIYNGHKSTFVVQMFGLPSTSELKVTSRPQVKEEQQTVKNINLIPDKKELRFKITTTKEVERVVLNYGNGKTDLNKTNNQNEWSGAIDMSKITNTEMVFEITNDKGEVVTKEAGSIQTGGIDDSILKNNKTKISFLGLNLLPKQIEYIFFGLATAFFITLLLVSIGVRRHYQHIPLIANTSFLIIFTTILWQWI